jgi:Ca2+-binding RTX toxin-like protein
MRGLAPALAAAAVLVAAPSASADSRAAIEPGNFGSGIEGGAVLTVRDQRDPLHDERIRVRVTRLSSGRWQVTDFEREVVAGPNCRRSTPSVVTCDPRQLDGIFMSGTKFGDGLNNDTGVASRIEGGDGDDVLDGGDANDTLIGQADDDTLSGRLGIDTAAYSGGPVVVTIDEFANDGGSAEDDFVTTDTENVVGTPSNDVIVGSEAANALTGRGGDDRIDGRGGNDTLGDGGTPSGADVLDGGTGIDTVTYLGRTTGVSVRLNGVADDGNDVDDGSRDDNVLNVENVAGTDGDDFIQGDAGANTFDGNGGDDSLQGLGGPDTLVGDRGGDTLNGGEGDDTLEGDVINGTDIAADVLIGGPGGDSLRGRSGDDRLQGDDGDDRIEGGNGRDTIDGGPGADDQQGDSGIDTVLYSNRTLPVRLTLGDVSGDDGDATDGPENARDTVRFIEHAITGEGDDVIEGSDVGEQLEPRGGRDIVRAAGGDDVLDTRDGIADDVDCGEGRDTLAADLADLPQLQTKPDLGGCELLDASPVGEGPNVEILTKRLRARHRARIRLHCPAKVTTDGCAGLLALAHPGVGKRLAARRYRLRKGKRAVVVLKLSHKDVRRLKRRRRAIVTATETSPSGRPKTTRHEIPVLGR